MGRLVFPILLEKRYLLGEKHYSNRRGLPLMHLATYAADGKTILNITGHYDRWGGDLETAAKREQIDPSLTRLNYNLAPERDMALDHYAERRLDYYSDLGAKLDDNSRPVCDVVLTMPKGLDAALAPQFFEAGYRELLRQMGGVEDDVVCAYVHLDEPKAQPHMHFCFIQASSKARMTNDKSQPLRWTKKDEARNPEHVAGTVKKDGKGTVKYKRVPVLDADGKPVMAWSLSPSAVWTKGKLRVFHDEVDKAVGKALGMPDGCGIRLGDDDERRKYSKLDHGEFRQMTKAKADMEAEAAEARRAAEKAQQEKALAEARLEGVRQAEQAGPAELVGAARDSGAEADKRAEEAAGQRLDREVADLERRVRAAEQRRDALAGRCRNLRAGYQAARSRLERAADRIIAALPHLAARAAAGHRVGILSAAACKAAEAVRQVCGALTPVWPAASKGEEAYVALAVDADCKVWQRPLPNPRLALEPTGVDARTGLTDAQAAEQAAERVAARKAERAAALNAQAAAAEAAALPTRQAARLAGLVSHNVAQWRQAMTTLGYKTYPATFGRFAAAPDGAGAAVVKPQTVSKRGGVLRYAGKPFEQALADVTNAFDTRVERGMTRAEAVSEVLALAEACRADGNSPEAMSSALRRGWIKQEVVDFAHEVNGWDYWQDPEQWAANKRARAAAAQKLAAVELQKKIDCGRPLTEAEKRGLTAEQRKAWDAAKRANNASHLGDGYGSTGTPGSGGGAAQMGRGHVR